MKAFSKLLLIGIMYATTLLTAFASPRAWANVGPTQNLDSHLFPLVCPVVELATDLEYGHSNGLGGDDVFPFEKVVIPSGQKGAWWTFHLLNLRAYFERFQPKSGGSEKYWLHLFTLDGIPLGWGELGVVGYNLEGKVATVIGIDLPVKFRSVKNRKTQIIHAWVEVGPYCSPVVALPTPNGNVPEMPANIENQAPGPLPHWLDDLLLHCPGGHCVL